MKTYKELLDGVQELVREAHNSDCAILVVISNNDGHSHAYRGPELLLQGMITKTSILLHEKCRMEENKK